MKSLLFLALFFFIWPFSSGGKTYHMSASNMVPAASGTVKAKTDHHNVNLDIKVSNLAKPANLVPAASVYLVWVRPQGEAAIKKGSIHIGDDLDGEVKVVTTSKNFEVMITAEKSVTATAPMGPDVLRTHVKLEG
jgi:hypothetical protein